MPIVLDGTNGITQADQFNSDSTFGFKNRIINGAMMIDQRNAGASVSITSSSPYTVDRWLGFATQSSKFTVQQNAGSVTPPTGFTNYLGCTSLSAYSVGASETFNIQHKIEGFNTADLMWGTANAKTITLSFWVRSSLTGTFGGVLRNGAVDRRYPFSYTISSADTWEQKSITIAGDTTGTWLTNNDTGINLLFSIGTGSSLSGTAGAWTASSVNSVTGAVSVVGTNGATWYVTGVQLEVGSTATSFDYENYTSLLNKCLRYYWKPDQAFFMQGISSGRIATNIFYPVQMRATPTFAISGTYWESVPYATVGSLTSATAEGSKLTSMGGGMSITGTFGTTPVQSYPGLFGAGQSTFSAEL